MPALSPMTVPLVAADGRSIGTVTVPLQVTFPVENPANPGVVDVDVSPVTADAAWSFDVEHEGCAGDRKIAVFAVTAGDNTEVGTLACCGTCMP